MVSLLLSVPLRSMGQSGAPPTIWPWIAVPRTVPRTSTVIPEKHVKTDISNKNNSITGRKKTPQRFWLHWSAAHTVRSGRVSLLLVLADEHGESRVGHMKALRKGWNMPLGPSLHNPDEGNDAWWDTYRLHWLEETVKHQVPEDVALSKGRHIPDKEVGQHSEWCGEDNPRKRKDGTNLMQFKAWKMLLIWQIIFIFYFYYSQWQFVVFDSGR